MKSLKSPHITSQESQLHLKTLKDFTSYICYHKKLTYCKYLLRKIIIKKNNNYENYGKLF